MSQRSQQRKLFKSKKPIDYDSIFSSDDDYGNSKDLRSSNTFSNFWPYFILLLGFCLYYGTLMNGFRLPSVVTTKEAGMDSPKFSGERSQQILHKFASLGPKVVGTYVNQVTVPKILMKELQKLKDIKHPSQIFEYEEQKGSGAYPLLFNPPYTNVYGDIKNVIGFIKGTNGSNSILLNCHTDSVITSDGASDNGVACAAMVEIIRALITSPQRYEHNIVFLFNGAEETALQASHLFLQHKWAKKCQIVINMDASGSGGQSVLFQFGPKTSWLLKYYTKNAPYPCAQVTGEEIFQSGLIPSDTDFRIFRDFGNMKGYDFAFVRNGYVYHTNFDNEAQIPGGSHQYLGDNILALVKAVANADEIYNPEEFSGGQMVYFDYLGLFVIAYTEETGKIINFITIFISLISIMIYKKRYSRISVKEIVISIFSRILGMACAVGACIGMAFVVNILYEYSMPWFSNTWLLFPLYWCPGIVFYSLGFLAIDTWRMKKKGFSHISICQLSLISYQIIMTVILFILTCANIRSACLIMIPVLLSSLGHFIIYVTTIYRNLKAWTSVYILVNTPFVIMVYQLLNLLLAIYIPIMGRSGPMNSDLNLAILSSVFLIYNLSFILPLLLVIRKPLFFLFVLCGISFACILLSVSSPLGHPYKDGPLHPAPQRFWITHTEKKFYDEKNILQEYQTGFYINNYDMNSLKTLEKMHLKYRNIVPVIKNTTKDCETKMYCGIPVYSSRMVTLSQTGSWIPSVAPKFPIETKLTVNKKSCGSSQCTFDISLTGPTNMALLISPKSGNNLVDWSLPSPQISVPWINDRKIHHVQIIRGEINGSYNITLKFDVTDAATSVADIQLSGNYCHDEKQRVKEYITFLDSFPTWTHKIAYTSSLNQYVI